MDPLRDVKAIQSIYPWCNDTAVGIIGDVVCEGKRLVAFPSVKRKDLILWKSAKNEQTPVEDVLNDFESLRKDFENTFLESPMAAAMRSSMSLSQMRSLFFYGALTAVLSEAEALYRKPSHKTSSKLIPARLVRPPAIHAILNNTMLNDPLFQSNVALVDFDVSGMAKGAATFKWKVTHQQGLKIHDIGA